MTPRSRLAGAIVYLSCLMALLPGAALAHGLRLAQLTIVPLDDQSLEVHWRSTAADPLPRLSIGGPCTSAVPSAAADAAISVRCAGPGSRALLRLAGLSPETQLVLSVGKTGQAPVARLLSGADRYEVPWADGSQSALAGAVEYVILGTTHIFAGADHLLFLLALLLLAPRPGALVRIATLFTIGHSATLALAATDTIVVDPALAELAIALTLVIAARELHRAPAAGVMPGHRLQGTALAFGLVHGLGFAGALDLIGLPSGRLVVSLAAFNLGVEIGQVALLLAGWIVLGAVRRAWAGSMALVARSAALLTGSAGVFWCLQRF